MTRSLLTHIQILAGSLRFVEAGYVDLWKQAQCHSVAKPTESKRRQEPPRVLTPTICRPSIEAELLNCSKTVFFLANFRSVHILRNLFYTVVLFCCHTLTSKKLWSATFASVPTRRTVALSFDETTATACYFKPSFMDSLRYWDYFTTGRDLACNTCWENPKALLLKCFLTRSNSENRPVK